MKYEIFFDHDRDICSRCCRFVDQPTAFANRLAYVTDDDKVVMKGDNTTWLASGVPRNRHSIEKVNKYPPVLILISGSVRIQSNAQYNFGLFILDLNQAPWGCGEL